MQFSLQTTIYIFLLSLSSSLASDDIPGGALLVSTNKEVVPSVLLEPQIRGNPLADGASGDMLQRREPTIVGGLLQIRQSCPGGYGLCDDRTRCCPIGGRCCSNGGTPCCKAGYWCYSAGCCSLTENGCDRVSCCPTDYNCCRGGGCCKPGYYCVAEGCCPVGEICSGYSGECVDSGYVHCPNDNYCCPAGSTCYRDSQNIRRCRSTTGGGAGTTTTPRSVPSITTSLSTDLPDITTTPSSLVISPSSASTSTQPPRPTAPLGQTTVVYAASDSRITWSGAGWTSGTSNCSTSARKTTTAMQSFTLIIDNATQVYLNVDCLNAIYDVYVNGNVRTFTVGTFGVTQVCSWKRLGLGGPTANVNVTVVVVGLPRSGRRQLDNNWSFQLNEILAMTFATAASPTSSVASALGLKVSWVQNLGAMLLAIFGLAL